MTATEIDCRQRWADAYEAWYVKTVVDPFVEWRAKRVIKVFTDYLIAGGEFPSPPHSR